MPKSIDELAMDWLLISLEPPSENTIHSTYMIFNEMSRRVGFENTGLAIDRAREILKIVGVK